MDDYVVAHALDKTYIVDINKELLVFPLARDVFHARAAAYKQILRIGIVFNPQELQILSHRIIRIQQQIDIHLAYSFHQLRRYNKSIPKSRF